MGLKIKKGDTVIVISGKYKGASGQVLAVLPKDEKVVVERVNLVKRHTKPRSQQQPGGIIEKEMPIHASNLMLVDPKTGRARRFRNENGKDGRKIRRHVVKEGEAAGGEL
jgi:large subunit ribosomal protein L24